MPRIGLHTARLVSAFAVSVLAVGLAPAQTNRITATEARNHVGELATVCGSVASTKFAVRSRGNPTFLNLDKPYPSQVFTVLIWGEDRPKFGRPEDDYQGKRICVTGMISSYRGVPQIVARGPGQIVRTRN